MSSAPAQPSHPGTAPPAARRPALPHRRTGSWQDWLTSPGRERSCLFALLVAGALSVAVGLEQTRGATFSIDEYLYFVVNRGFDLKTLLSPHNGNLIAVIRLLYAVVFKLAGPNYFVFRVIQFAEVAITGGLFYALVRRRVGPVVALALTLPLLFLGSAPDVAVSTIGIAHLSCFIACLGALLALEMDSRLGDGLACLLLSIAVATFSIAFAFIAGVAVSVLLRRDRWRRVWIFLVPGALYLVWLMAAPKYSGVGYLGTTTLRLSNLLLLPSFVANAAAAVAAAVTGLSYDFWHTGTSSVLTTYYWGIPLAAAAVVALVWRARRGRVNPWFWSYLAIPLAFWLSVVMAIQPNRYPNSVRYVYDGAVAVLLLAAESLRGVRFRASALAGLLAASAVALAGNIAQMRVDGSLLRASGAIVRSGLGAIELARDHVHPTFLPPNLPYLDLMITWGGGVKPYLEAVQHNGSFAFSVPQLRRQSEKVRRLADATLAGALRVHLSPLTTFTPMRACRRGRPMATHLTVRPPGAVLWSINGGTVRLGRFASAQSVRSGSLRPRQFSQLIIPGDRSDVPWQVWAPGGIDMVCPRPSG